MISMALDRDPRRTWSKPTSHRKSVSNPVFEEGMRYEPFKRERVLHNDRIEIVPNPKHFGVALQSTVLTNCKQAPTPSVAGSVKQKLDDDAVLDMQERRFYRGIVGSLQYLSIDCCDLHYETNVLCEGDEATDRRFMDTIETIGPMARCIHLGTDHASHGVFFHSLSDSDDPRQRAGVRRPTPHKPHLSFSCISCFFLSANTFVSHDCGIRIFLAVVRSLLCVSRTDILEYCWCSVVVLRIATAVFGMECRCVSNTIFIQCARHSFSGFSCGLQKTYLVQRERQQRSGHVFGCRFFRVF